MAAAAHREDRRVAEEARHALERERRRGHDQLELGTARQHALEHAEQQIHVERPLVGLVDDDGVVATQFGVRADLRQEQSVGHEHQSRRMRTRDPRIEL